MELFAAPPLAAMLEPDPVPGRLRKPSELFGCKRKKRTCERKKHRVGELEKNGLDRMQSRRARREREKETE